MNGNDSKAIRIAILDLYEGVPNEGMRCIRDILKRWGKKNNLKVTWDEFEVRLKNQVPDMSYDIYISSGGPGSPLESIGNKWEQHYFNWLGQIENWNNEPAIIPKKSVLFICHSFQLACRHYELGAVKERKSTAFGVFPIHLLEDGKNEPVFNGLSDPFYAVDSRNFQVVEPNRQRLQEMGAKLLAIEKERLHIPYERAIMAIRFNECMIGTQFHPEADAIGMTMYLKREDKKEMVISTYGEEKWRKMIEHLNDPDKILMTNSHVIPNFLNLAVEQMLEVV